MPASLVLTILGIAFMVVWLGAAAVWAAMSLMGGLMANDAGRVPAGTHATLLMVLVAGEVLVALAGIPGGLAVFWAGWRAVLLWTFAILLVVGIGLQLWAAWSFASAAGS
jgi:hypothetical protein